MEPISSLDVAIRLLVAAGCGGAVGWERGRSRHSAGLRTQMLISLGAAAFVVVSLRWITPGADRNLLQVDPGRVLQGIVSGVGLLAGGAIIRSKGSVHGLTTASSVWAVTAVGAAAGFGQFDTALILTLLILLVTGVLVYVDPKETRHGRRPGSDRTAENRDARVGQHAPERGRGPAGAGSSEV